MQPSSNKNVFSILAIILCAICFGGCSAIVSPYKSEFQCPIVDKGKCVSVQTAYKESVDNPLVKSSDETSCETCDDQEKADAKAETPNLEYKYQDSLYKKLASLIEQPSTPIVVPPDVVRVLILSYTGSDNELFGYRYVYFFATQPEWVISTTKEAE
jgi:conjugal transfer pilus assembly protein TraV